MPTRPILPAVIAIILAATLGCNTSGDRQRKADVTPPPVGGLYEQLGERTLRAVVNDTVDMSAKDPKVALDKAGKAAGWSATPQNIEQFKQGLFQFVAAASGGPQVYRGDDMVTVHKDMNITNEQFDAMMSHLQKAMDKNNVPPQAQQGLRKVFDGTRGAIVQRSQQ